MSITFPSRISGLNGQDNVSGLKQNIYLAREDWFTTLAEPARKLGDGVGPTAPDEIIRITADHIFDVTNGFIEAYTTDDTQSLEIPPPPARDQNGAMATLNAFYPGFDPVALGVLTTAANYRWVVLAESPNGQVFQLGQKGLTASVRAGIVTNTLTGERAGVNIVIEAFMVRPILYEGVITPHP